MEDIITSSMEVLDAETVRKNEIKKQIGFLNSTKNFLLTHYRDNRHVYINFVCIGFGMSMPIKDLSEEEVATLVSLMDARINKLENIL